MICILQAWVHSTTLQRKKAAAKAWAERDEAAGLIETAFGAWKVLAMLRPAAADAHAKQRLRCGALSVAEIINDCQQCFQHETVCRQI